MSTEKPTEPGYTNAFWNVLEPLRSGKSVMGVAEYVAIEVLVGQLVRRSMGMKYNWADATETHLYSVPMIGQLNFGLPFADLNVAKDAKVELMDEATEGAKAIPGAIVGYTAHRIRQNGLRIPAYGNRDFIALMVGKILSRPITAYLFSSLPNDFQTALLVLNNIMNRQKAVIVDSSAKKEDY